jgi:hypothetical protein
MADLRFGRCQTPNSPPASQALSPVIRLTRVADYPADISGNSGNSTSSSEEDEVVEIKRQKLDPDYQPSTESTETETEDSKSWRPSRSTSPE